MLALLLTSTLTRWKRYFPQWFAAFRFCFRYQAQRDLAARYIQGLCSTAHRKSMEPLAHLVAPGQYDRLQHFITDSPWQIAGLEQIIADRAQYLLGGKRAVLIVDDTCLTKFGSKSVGVGRQYSGQVGKITNCQCLVSLTLARDEIPLPVRLKLFLPSEWSNNLERCRQAGVVTVEMFSELQDRHSFAMQAQDTGSESNFWMDVGIQFECSKLLILFLADLYPACGSSHP